MDTESQWTYDRIRLHKLRQKHPDWTQQQLADALNYSLSWVKKWLRRIREAADLTLEVFNSQSRAPKNPFRKVTRVIRDTILHLRQTLPERYGRVVGAEPILYHLHHDGYFTEDENLPTSSTTVYTVLKEAGYIPEKRSFHEPLPTESPMEEWEFDFAEVRIASDAHFEIAPIIDRGTSILITVAAIHGNYQADTALAMLIEVFRDHGYPPRFRFDRDSRLIGSVGMDEFPSALMRFAWCIGMEPVLCPPARPDKKPYVERVIRTLKHENLYQQRPATQEQVREALDDYVTFYNHERAHQGPSCRNQPPMSAHPQLPRLRTLPTRLNPDAWLDAYHGQLFKRHVDRGGTISIDNHRYFVGQRYALQVAAVHLDAIHQVFHITIGGERLAPRSIQGLHHRFMDFEEYTQIIIAEAQAIARRQS